MADAAKQSHSQDIEKWLALIRAEGVGPILFSRLLKHFETIDRIMGASVAELTRVERVGNQTAERIARTRDKFDCRKEIEQAEKLGVWLVHRQDVRYPLLLTEIYDPPPVLYVKGTLNRTDSLGFAIVGSRRCSAYGSEQASRFACLLADMGFTIVSGLARGIDSAAHHGALAAKGRTLAVQGCGLGQVFPPENKRLFEQIAESGAVLSELPMGAESLAEHFPPRNRIIAGLSMGVLVIEAARGSGALITAKAALDSNREVMAVPGKIDSPLNAGSHLLLKQGAKLVDSVADIMDTLGVVGQDLMDYAVTEADKKEKQVNTVRLGPAQMNLTDQQQKVLNCLDSEPVHIEDVIIQTQLPAGLVHSAIVHLQLKQLIRRLPGGFYTKRTVSVE